MTPHLSPLSHHKNSPKDLAQSFKALIYELFSLEVAQADAQTLHDLEQSYGEFDFGGAIVCFTSTSSSETLSSSSLGHTNLAFTLICSKPSATLSKSLYAKATQAINRAIPSYNIIFFLNPQEDLLTISFATRREHKRAADQDVLERVIIIKDLSLLSPSKGHLRNLDSIAKASKTKKQTPTPIDTLYQESIKALSIESLNEKFYQEIVQIFIALIDSIQLPTPSLRADEIGAAIHKSKVDSSDEAMDCHADKSARNDKKKVDSSNEADSKRNAKNLSDSQAAGLCDNDTKAENAFDSQAVGGRIFDEKAGLCSGEQGDKTRVSIDAASHKLPAFSQKADAQNAVSQDNTKREFSLRLLSRLLFCKFLEKKGIIDTAIFSTTLSGNYYHEVLEPLFFTTLNTPKNARDYDLLDPHIAALLEQIPYLNGGLFAPQASDFYSPSRPNAYHTTLKVPNAPLAELFTLLESYHFSIDESTPDAQEVGLNPELLGMVFESLLSELFTDNRKDSTSSLRKSTGSYYTPREIVQYMCRTSLYQYLLSKMDSAFGDRVGFLAKNGDCGGESALITTQGKSLDSPCKAPFLSQKSCREQTAPESSTAKPATAVQGEAAAGFFRNLRILEEKSRAEQTTIKSTSGDKTAAQKSCREQTALSPSLRGEAEAIHPTPSLRALREQSVAIHKSKVDSSVKVDCHADKSARNDKKKADSKRNAKNLSEQAQDSRICDEKSGLCEHSQGRALGVRNRRECEAIADLSRKAESTSDKPTPEAIHALIFHQDPSHLPPTTHAQILAALSTLKVLDPACGSGAFPIGLMQEILDLQDLLGDTRSPYTRKLEILQSNIYGIDIQPMATEISRLRCFLSLIVDESPHSIAPLPNLEFKFLSANSLLPLPQDSMLEYDGYQADKQKLESIRQANFTADLKSREKLKQDYLETAAHIARNLILHDQGESPLTLWNPYDPHSVAGFFDSEYMFGLSGFDIVIGNPPYMQVPKGVYPISHFPYSEGKDKGKQNLYKVFVEHAYNIANDKGISCLITQSSLMCDLSASYTRNLLLTQTQIQQIIEFPKNPPTKEGRVFKSVLQGTCIVLFAKDKPLDSQSFNLSINNDKTTINKLKCETIAQKQILDFYPQRFEIPLITQGEMPLLQKIKTDKVLLESLLDDTLQGNINTIHLRRIQAEKETGFYLMKGENIHRYYFDNNFMHCKISNETTKIVERNQKGKYIIAMQGITGTTDINRIHCTLLESKNTNFVFLDSTKMLFLPNANIAKFIVGILNSRIIDWLFRKTSTNNNINIYELESLPIPKITESNQHIADEITQCVDKILESKKQGKDTQELESKLDKIVYGLYDLNNDEIKIVEKG